ncbi:hypothetical protein GLOIN_2v1838743 [Rhizophagus irregularis DAOM 181602=DAOM 197198]|uniref:Myb/SANT-like DNA-binding domain-containing protein n=1 Tax=Rhizophagus irregularis (strain DAOM 181602 / DAOM 197198 / MUCL 43194) TaxID=747089 RepID=A0A2P4QCI9_RHIID|nr:hypothetical protein GLOIN_2v1838743 [Rhizophagus irregularis DAOM 181602=DAOM 197198]POG75339.1 hypothetical protein GLOIN_2v1838743 [Rhizophagus irregularis DAOM 181602=DAOM 197198]|eukprot:XP_025182205.1 hypothetical protein GLOIN_2v1838743 [Rhizophagus irregularis DAOM 181602=DAOM 197198]
MAEWTDPQIRTLIDECRTRNDEFHNLRRNRKIFWNSIADKINQKNGTSFNGHQCKEKFSNLVQDYNAMCDFMSGRKSSRSRLEQLVGQRRTSTHEELSLSLYLPPFYDIATAQESSNVRGNIQ